jgi:hypothetical protein
MKKLIFGAMLLTLALFLASCQKYDLKDFSYGSNEGAIVLNIPSGVMAKAKSASAIDTLKLGANIQTKMVLTGLASSETYTIVWNFGDNKADTLIVKNKVDASVEHKYIPGAYNLTVTIKGLIGGKTVIKNLIIIVSNLYGQDATIILIATTSISNTGGYEYKLGFLCSMISGFVDPPYSSSIPFVTGKFCDWKLDPPPSAPDYMFIEGRLYIIKMIAYDNSGSATDLQYGQGLNWSYNPSSIYWVSTGTKSGKYVIYPSNGKIYNFAPNQPVSPYIPGEDGDAVQGDVSPTIRDSVILGATSLTDSLRLFVNYGVYANGTEPFVRYVENKDWVVKKMKLISNIGWGYITVSISKILENNGRIYFRFGPSSISPTVYGKMETSKFYLSDPDLLGMQIMTLKSVPSISGVQNRMRYNFVPVK